MRGEKGGEGGIHEGVRADVEERELNFGQRQKTALIDEVGGLEAELVKEVDHSHVSVSLVDQVCQGLACAWFFITPDSEQLKFSRWICSACAAVAYCGLACQG